MARSRPSWVLLRAESPRTITHRKYLEDVEAEIHAFNHSAYLLQEKLGVILLQIASGTPYDLERLRSAMLAFEDPRNVVVEFRRKFWITQETMDLLKELGVTFCDADSPKCNLVGWITSDQVYLRLHGRKRWYSYDYTIEELHEIAILMKEAVTKGVKRVYVFFNNDFEGYAPKNAITLLEILKDS